jgi:hypothetical protein
MSAQNNLTLDQGTSFTYNVYLIDSSGVAIDLTGFTGNSQLRTSYTSNVYFTMNVAVSTVNTGLITLSMNTSTTSLLTASKYLYDVKLTSNNNVVSRLMEGVISVNKNVTR